MHAVFFRFHLLIMAVAIVSMNEPAPIIPDIHADLCLQNLNPLCEIRQVAFIYSSVYKDEC